MKRHFSIGVLATILTLCMTIGLSGFRSSTYQPYDPLPKLNHHIQREFGVEDLGVFRYRVDLPGFAKKSMLIKSQKEVKPDNTKHQIIHWQHMQYYSKL